MMTNKKMNITGVKGFEYSNQGIRLITDADVDADADAAAATAGAGANHIQDVITHSYSYTHSYSDALDALNEGDFDNDLPLGFDLAIALLKAVRAEHFNITNLQRVTLYRWLVAASFIAEQIENNGYRTQDDRNGNIIRAGVYLDGDTALVITPADERLLLADKIENEIYAHYEFKHEPEKTEQMLIRIYQDFINPNPKPGNLLSSNGRKGLTLLHNDAIHAIKSGEFNHPITVH